VSVAVLLDKFIKTSDRLCEEELKQKREVKQSKETVKYILDPLLELLTAVSNDPDDFFSGKNNGILSVSWVCWPQLGSNFAWYALVSG
jgi:hypothetical protein